MSSLSDLAVVYKAQGRLDAESIKGFLEAQGIPIEIDQSALGQVYGLTIGDLGQVDVLVRPADYEKARALLIAMERGEFENEILADVEPLDEAAETEPGFYDDELQGRKRVLVLCTGNSARSQMAEAVINHDFWQHWFAVSAGTAPTGFVHPMAVRVLEEAGFHHQGRSKSVDEFSRETFDLVLTVCDNARETCPIWLKDGETAHIAFADPAAFQGTDEEKLAVFRNTLAQIREKLPQVLEKYA